MYVYDFQKTTGAKKATEKSLELLCANMVPNVKEEDLVPKLPPNTSYPRFALTQRGLSYHDHRQAIREVHQEGHQEGLLKGLQEISTKIQSILPNSTLVEELIKEKCF